MKLEKRIAVTVLALALCFATLLCLNPAEITQILMKQYGAESRPSSTASGDLTFVVPEVIYCYPDAASSVDSTVGHFQYYVNNNSDGTVKAGTTTSETTGYIYYSLSGAGNATLRYQFYDSALSTVLNNCNVTLSSSTISNGGYVSITGGYTSSLASTTTGCYVRFELSYTDPADSKAKKAYAYSYVYKPFVDPVASSTASGGRSGTSYGFRVAGQVTWISGFHSITQGSQLADSDFDNEKFEYTNNARFSSFISENITGYINGVAKTGSQAGITDGFTVSPSDTGGSLGYCVFTNGTDSYKMKTDYASESIDGNSKGDYNAMARGDASYSGQKKNLTESRYYKNKKTKMETCYTNNSYGEIFIDTSRYSNLNQIPNLGIGMICYNRRNTSKESWYVADFTGRDLNVTAEEGYNTYHSDSGNDYYNDKGTVIASQGTSRSNGSNASVAGIKYCGKYPKALAGSINTQGATQEYMVKGFYGCWDDNANPCANIVVKLKATYYNKSALRTSVNNAIKAFAKLGVNGVDSSGYITSTYFDATTSYGWTTLQTAYKNAVIGLTKLDSAPSNVATLASSLDNALANLYTKVSYNANGGSKAAPGDEYVKIGTNNTASVTKSYSGTKTGYTFTGWSTNQNASTGSNPASVGYNNTLYAIWEPNKYDILLDNEFDFDAANFPTTGVNVKDISINGDTNTVSFKLSNTSDAYMNYQQVPMILIGGNTYKFTYNFTKSNSASPRMTILTGSDTIDYGTDWQTNYCESVENGKTYTIPSNRPKVVLRPGASGTKTTNETITYSNICVRDVTSYTVSGEGCKIATYNAAPGSITVPTRTGHTFQGYYTAKNGGGTQIIDASGNIISGVQSYTDSSGKWIKAENVKLYSHWTPITYNITYDYNHGYRSNSTYPASATYDTEFAIAEPIRPGYTFAGWTVGGTNVNYDTAKYRITDGPETAIASSTKCINATKVNGNGEMAYPVWFKNLSATSGGAVTITANWTEDTYTYAVDYKGGGTNISNTDYRTSQGYSFTKNPTKTGYTFAGWTVEYTMDMTKYRSGMLRFSNVSNQGGELYYPEGTAYTSSIVNKMPMTFLPGIIYTATQNGTNIPNNRPGATDGYYVVPEYWHNSSDDTTMLIRLGSSSTKGPEFTLHNSSGSVANVLFNMFVGNIKTGEVKFTGTIPANKTANIGVAGSTGNVKYTAKWTPKQYYLDLNGWLDGKEESNISGFGTADVYINGLQVANDVTDFYTQYDFGSSYEIKNIKAAEGHSYVGVHSGSLTGTVGGTNGADTSVFLEFKTNKYKLTLNPDNGTGTTSVVTQDYGSTYEVTNPTKNGYTFQGWEVTKVSEDPVS
ncbi:MAG: InlB B-repeat-containing protein [Clostridiales bacterium]|nr:InlB B-repeat-containing protein [Clostridiales bacterium]